MSSNSETNAVAKTTKVTKKWQCAALIKFTNVLEKSKLVSEKFHVPEVEAKW